MFGGGGGNWGKVCCNDEEEKKGSSHGRGIHGKKVEGQKGKRKTTATNSPGKLEGEKEKLARNVRKGEGWEEGASKVKKK